MRVFISWSGNRSHQVAKALATYLPRIHQRIRPWLSSEDIVKGISWSSEIATVLEQTDIGILCITKESAAAPWLLFEAGALSKKVGHARVIPYLLDVSLAELRPPLSLLNAATANEDETIKVIRTINIALAEEKLEDVILADSFRLWWPRLQETLRAIKPAESRSKTVTTESQHLEEIKGLLGVLIQRTSLPESPKATVEPTEGAVSRRRVGTTRKYNSYNDELQRLGARIDTVKELLKAEKDSATYDALKNENDELLLQALEVRDRALRVGINVVLPTAIRMAEFLADDQSLRQ